VVYLSRIECRDILNLFIRKALFDVPVWRTPETYRPRQARLTA